MRRMPKTLKSRMTKPVTCISPDASRVYHWPVKLEKVPMSAKRVPNSKYSLNFHQLSFIIYLRSIYIQCKRLISKKCSEFLWRASLLIVCIIRWVMTVRAEKFTAVVRASYACCLEGSRKIDHWVLAQLALTSV